MTIKRADIGDLRARLGLRLASELPAPQAVPARPVAAKTPAAQSGPPYTIPEPGPHSPWMDECGRIHRPNTKPKKAKKK